MTTIYTTKHYLDLAEFLSQQRDAVGSNAALDTIIDLARDLARHFEADNHRFSRAKFLSDARC